MRVTYEDDELRVPVSIWDKPRVHTPRDAEVLPVLLRLLYVSERRQCQCQCQSSTEKETYLG